MLCNFSNPALFSSLFRIKTSDNIIELIASDVGYRIQTDGEFDAFSSSLQSTQTIESSHDKASFSRRKPDVVVYNGNLKGAYAITMLGDVRGCRSANDFPDAEVGHILEMSKVLFEEHQFSRTFLYSFLTNGSRFQFFKCFRNSTGRINFQESLVFSGLDGWQVLLFMSLAAHSFTNPCRNTWTYYGCC
jgi:hypothetical protein